ncbi:MAG TPA: hypothetical protein PKW61_00155 [Tenuifilaceae bacterium]|nr:hypothetical protein [Tenuifilaceae bacterium]
MAKNSSYPEKYTQLKISFNEIPAVCEFLLPDMDNFKKLYTLREMGQHPFFLYMKTEKVQNSRVAYLAAQKGKDDVKIKLSDLEYRTSKNWSILASHRYGLPDNFDGLVWNYILNFISSVYNKTGKFYFIYFIDPADIVHYLVGKKLFAKSSFLYQRVRDSIYRLKHTNYLNSQGFFDKYSGKMRKDLSFSLIDSIYDQGATLPDGTVASSMAIGLNHLLIINFSNNHFLILLNSFRANLSNYGSMILFDRLSFLAFNAITHFDFSIAKAHNFPYIVVMGYSQLCEFFGFKEISKKSLYASKVAEQFEKVVDELKDHKCLDDMLVDFVDSDKIRLIFVFNRDFIDSSIELFSQDKVLAFKSYNPSISEANAYFSKMKNLVVSESLRKKLFSSDAYLLDNAPDLSPVVNPDDFPSEFSPAVELDEP